MSATIEESDEVLEDRRERRIGETFMSSFAAVGALLLLDAGKADAALPDPAEARPAGESADPLRGAMTSADEDTSGPPAVSDSAFLEAIAALSPPPSLTTDMSSSSTVGAATPDPFAPPEEAPSAQPDEAANDTQFMMPGSIAVIGSAQLSALAGGAARSLEGGNEAAFAIGADTINIFAGAGPSLIAAATLAGEPTLPLGGLSHAAQATGSDDAVNAEAGLQSSLSGESGNAAVSEAGDRVGAMSETAMLSLANPAVQIVADIVIDLSRLSAFGAVYPGALDLFAAQTSGGGDRLGFVGPEASLAIAGVERVEVAGFAAAGQVRLP